MYRLLALSFFILSAFACKKTEPVLPGDVESVNDAIFGNCSPYDFKDTHTCVYFADAFSKRIVTFDATDHQFILAPIAYAPLSVMVPQRQGSMSRLAHSHDRLFGLDTEAGAIHVFHTKNDATLERPFGDYASSLAFLQSNQSSDTSVIDMTSFDDPTNPATVWLMVLLSQPLADSTLKNTLLAIPYDTSIDAESQTATKRLEINLPDALPKHLARSHFTNSDEDFIAISSASSDIFLIDFKDILARTAQIAYLPAGGPTQSLHIAQMPKDGTDEPYIFAVRKTGFEIVAIPKIQAQPSANLAFAGQTVSFDSAPMLVHASGQGAQACCRVNNAPLSSWVLVATQTGLMQYLSWPDLNKVSSAQKGKIELGLSRNFTALTAFPRALLAADVIAPDKETQKLILDEDKQNPWGRQLYVVFYNGTVATSPEGGINFQDLEYIAPAE